MIKKIENVINSVTDVVTGEINGRITSGGGINLADSKTRITGDNPANGLALIHQTTKDEVKTPLFDTI